MKEKFKKWAEGRGINVSVSEAEVLGYTFASTHTEDMYLAYQQGLSDAGLARGGAVKVPAKASDE